MLRGAGLIILAVGLFAPVGWWLITHDDKAGVLGAEQEELIAPTGCHPEPAERTTYLLAVITLPTALFGLTWLTRRWGEGAAKWHLWRLALEGVLSVGLVGVAWWAAAGDGMYHLRHHLFATYPLLGTSLFLITFTTLFWPRRAAVWVRGFGWVVAVAVAALVAYGSVINERHPYASGYHFNAFYAAAVSAYQGRVLTVDTVNQYGLYAQLLQPLFSLIGLNVTTFTATLGVLTAVSYLAVWFGLVRVGRNPWVALFGLLALVFFNWLMSLDVSADRYYQYRPLRILFPMLAFAGAVWYHWRPTRWLYWASLVGLSVGVLWNVDAGVPAFVAWLGGRGLTAVAKPGRWVAVREIAAHGLKAAGVLAATFATYAAVVYVASGVLPQFGQMLVFQRMFYLTGLAMHPMPFPGAWVLVGLVYLAGLAFAFRKALSGDASPQAHAALVLSLLGIALFSYYQGRSHTMILYLAGWPALPLAAVLLDVLASTRRLCRPLSLTAAVLLLWVLAGAAGGVVPSAAECRDFERAQLAALSEDFPTGRAAEFLNRYARPGDEVLALSSRDALLHQLSGTRSLSLVSFNELLRKVDEAEMLRRFDQGRGPWVFRDRRTSELDFTLLTLLRLGQERFAFVAGCDEGEVWEYRPGSPTDGLAVAEVGAAMVRFRDAELNDGLRMLHAPTGPWVTLEAVVRPHPDQQPYAVLVSNLSTKDALRGYALVQTAPGTLTLVTADGGSLRSALNFPIDAGRWNHLMLTFDPTQAVAYVNGRQAALGTKVGLPSPSPDARLIFGDAPQGGRAFRGQVRRWRMFHRTLSPEEVAAEARLVDPGERDPSPVPTAEEWERRKADPRNTPTPEWGQGFSIEEPSHLLGGLAFRWSNTVSELRLMNDTPEPRRVRLGFVTHTMLGPGTLRVIGPGFEDTVPVSVAPGQYEQEFELAPGTNSIRFRCDAPPHVHPNRTVVFAVHGLTISAATAEPILRWGEGFSFEEKDPSDPAHRFRWSDADGTLTVWNPTPNARRLKMTFLAVPFASAPCTLKVGGPGGGESIQISAGGATFSRTYEFPPGPSVVQFRCDGEKSVTPARSVAFRLHRFTLNHEPK